MKVKVMTYGQTGKILSLNPRVVGWALNRLAKMKQETQSRKHETGKTSHASCFMPHVSSSIPWQRVINSKGGISTNKLMNIPLDLQKRLLEKEGIKFDENQKINLKKYLWYLKSY